MTLRFTLAALAAVTLLAATVPGAPGPLLHPACADAAEAVTFATNDLDLENLHFHEGRLYVTGGDGLLWAYDPSGDGEVVWDLGARSGAMVTGPDGALYVRVGSEPGEVWRFDGDGSPTVVATGLRGANGMALDAAGNLYVSDEPDGRLYKLPAGSYADWEVWTTLDWPNGIVVDDDAGVLYAAMTVDGRSTILAVSLEDPSDVREVAHLSFGAFSLNVFYPVSELTRAPVALHAPSDPSQPALFKALDDLDLAPDGNLYAAAWLTGEVLRVDPETGAACAVAAGLAQPSSVRVAHGFGSFDGHLFVTDFGGPGQLLVETPERGSVSVIPLGIS